MPKITLTGCHPEPLMSYLKSLGILRLVAEQKYPETTAYWQNDNFVLSSELNEEEFIKFFLLEYKPTPIIGPWAGGSGFFKGDNQKAVNAILSSKNPRAQEYQNVIKKAQDILSNEKITEKPTEMKKEKLLKRYRQEMPEIFIEWMDAAMVLQSEGQSFAPVLGTGGNDGRLDFSQNFMVRLEKLNVFDEEVDDFEESLNFLNQSLFGIPIQGMGDNSVGQFSPNRAGGPNATQGMEGGSNDNPWDYILMLEGALLLAGSVVRRLGVQSTDKAAFPFTVRSRPIGESSPSEEESNSARGELWLPIWSKSVSYGELETLFAEGRAELSGKPARDTVDFARAVAGLGIDRGIRSFARYGFLKRSGKAYLATAMDRFQVPKQSREASELLREFDFWLDKFRRACSAKETPTRFKSTLRRIDSGIFNYCRYGRRQDIESVFLALGQAEKELAITCGKRGGKEICAPLANLSPQWLQAIDDGSEELRIALSLAGIHDRTDKIYSIRSNIESIQYDKRRWQWQEGSPYTVWKNADLPSNMAAVLERRIMDGTSAGCDQLPIEFKKPLSLNIISSFIANQFNNKRIEELLWGFILLNHRVNYPKVSQQKVEFAQPLPREYALLKLLFLPRPLIADREELNGEIINKWRLAKWEKDQDGASCLEESIHIRPEPQILPLLRTGRTKEACCIACQRLRVSGLEPLPGRKTGGIWRDDEWEIDPSINPQRLAAALLLPIGDNAINKIVHLVTRQEEFEDENEIINLT